MSTKLERTKKVITAIGFTTLVLIPIECIRIVSICVSIVPLTLFHGTEYIVTGEEQYTEQVANFIEHGGKKQVESLAKKAGIDSRIY